MKKIIRASFDKDGKFEDMEIDAIISNDGRPESITYRYISFLANNKKDKEFIFTTLKIYEDMINSLKPLLKEANIGIIEGPKDMWCSSKKSIELNKPTNVNYYKIKPTPNLR